jgi:murein DD-endopeptidase MepM/ murein hydrolase activator NlpD
LGSHSSQFGRYQDPRREGLGRTQWLGVSQAGIRASQFPQKATALAGAIHFWGNENAIDLNVPYGTPVCAIFDGTISPGDFKLGDDPPNGKRLYLVGRNDIAFYTHLSRIPVKKRDKVRRGQLLAFSGCGSEGVPHLHLGLLRGDPERYAPPRLNPVSGRRCSN